MQVVKEKRACRCLFAAILVALAAGRASGAAEGEESFHRSRAAENVSPSERDLVECVEELEAENRRLRQQIQQLESRLETLNRQAEDLSIEKQQLAALAGLTPEDRMQDQALARFTQVVESGSQRPMMQSPTTVLDVAGEPGSHWMALRYPLELPEEGAAARWVIETRYTSGRYEQLRMATLQLEGREVQVPILRYDRAQRRQRGTSGQRAIFRYHEVVELALPREVLRILARQQVVTGRLGHAPFTLSREQIALLQAVQMRMDEQREHRQALPAPPAGDAGDAPAEPVSYKDAGADPAGQAGELACSPEAMCSARRL